MGEGEQRFVRLIELLSSGNFRQLEKFTAIAYKNKRDIIIKPPLNPIQNLDEIPFPEINENIGMILTSRGCPQNCNFCSVASLMGKKVRLRSVKSVIKEIEIGIQKSVRKFDFEDDNLTINRNRSKTLFKEIKNRFDKYHLHLSAMNGIMADSVDEELIQLMKQAGFEWLNIPFVSGSSEVQQKINRFQSG